MTFYFDIHQLSSSNQITFLFESHCILESWLQIYLQKSNIYLRCHVNIICIAHNFSNYNPINSALLMSLHMRTISPVATQKLHHTFGSSVFIYSHDVFIRCVFSNGYLNYLSCYLIKNPKYCAFRDFLTKKLLDIDRHFINSLFFYKSFHTK